MQMRKAIEKHRTCSLRLLALRQEYSTVSFVRSVQLQIACAKEYLARRRLVRKKALGPQEARQKTLYCIALTLALQQNFTPKQTARIHRSLRDFAEDVRKEIGLEHHS
jgi:hypothetical protein